MGQNGRKIHLPLAQNRILSRERVSKVGTCIRRERRGPKRRIIGEGAAAVAAAAGGGGSGGGGIEAYANNTAQKCI